MAAAIPTPAANQTMPVDVVSVREIIMIAAFQRNEVALGI